MKIIYENCGVKNYMKKDHRSYRRNFCSCGKGSLKEKSRTGLNFFRFAFRNCKSCVYNYHDLLSYKRTNYNTSLVIFTGKALKLEKHGAIFVKFQSHIRSYHLSQRVQQTTGNNIVFSIKTGSLFVEFI